MPFWTRLWNGAPPQTKVKGGKNAPLYSPVCPGSAATTPHAYGALASEGYAKNVIVFRAVNLVARALSSLPLRVRKGEQVLEVHPALDLLAAPNPKMDGNQLIVELAGSYLIAGNAYMLGVGMDSSAPKELWPLRPDTVSVIPGTDGLVRGFEQRSGGQKRLFETTKVMHWKTYNPLSDWVGMAPLSVAATAVDAHNAGTRWNLALIQNGGTPSGVLYQEDGETPLTPDQFEALKAQVEDRVTGPDNAGRPLLLEGGLKWQSMGLSPKDMDWLQAQHMTAREIALAFGVPPQMLGIPDAQTYSNFAEARLSLWEDTILPLAYELVAGLNRWLMPRYSGGAVLSLDLDDVPALEPKRQRRFDRIANASFLSDAEKRSALGFASLPTGNTP